MSVATFYRERLACAGKPMDIGVVVAHRYVIRQRGNATGRDGADPAGSVVAFGGSGRRYMAKILSESLTRVLKPCDQELASACIYWRSIYRHNPCLLY
jgi:hypothetical protein